jgi:hypothetical protein
MVSGRFLNYFRSLKANLVLEKPTFILHTPFGPMRIGKIRSDKETGYVTFDVKDETDQQRLFAFSEEQLLSMPIEVTSPLITSEKRSIGFGPADIET